MNFLITFLVLILILLVGYRIYKNNNTEDIETPTPTPTTVTPTPTPSPTATYLWVLNDNDANQDSLCSGDESGWAWPSCDAYDPGSPPPASECNESTVGDFVEIGTCCEQGISVNLRWECVIR